RTDSLYAAGIPGTEAAHEPARNPQGAADLVAIGDDMTQIWHDHMDRIRELRGRLVRVRDRRDGVKVAGENQGRHGGEMRTPRQRSARSARSARRQVLRRHRPGQTRVERRNVHLRIDSLVDRERREQIGPVLARVLEGSRILPITYLSR